jgi:NADPH-dependent glutamate synthase beta subunit-like oxidoreductase
MPPGFQIAVVGAGPAGCYLADALGRKLPEAAIDIYDRLPTPFGLLRGGVAPDHPGTKNLSRQFERLLSKDSVRFRGNVTVGRDVSVYELRGAYDVTVFATGAMVDRRLGIGGEDLPGVYGSARFVGWYNGIPHESGLAPHLGSSVAIIGNGNVALDIARLLAKSAGELDSADLALQARAAFSAAPVRDIWVIGRRGPEDAAFSSTELAELNQLSRAQALVDPADLPLAWPADEASAADDERRKQVEKTLAIFHQFAIQTPDAGKPVKVRFVFRAKPIAILGDKEANQIELAISGNSADQSHRIMRIPVATVVTAIGYRSEEIPGLPFDEKRGTLANNQGYVAPGIYATGWCRRGAQGVVPANRADALAVAERVLTDLKNARSGEKAGGALIDGLLAQRSIRVIDYAGWQRINLAETTAGAVLNRPREKICRHDDLLAAAIGTS